MSNAESALSLREATRHAQSIIESFRPFCDRIEVAGSIRRGKPWVHDVEIVCIPKSQRRERTVVVQPADIFTAEVTKKVTDVIRDAGYIECLESWAKTIVKGAKLGEAKYTQFITHEGVKVDMFTATPENWGYIFMIRTGSAEYSHAMLGRANKFGMKGEDGMLTRHGQPIPVREEKDFFELVGLPFVAPHERG